LTAAVIDSRDFIAARCRSETELLLPKSPKIAFSGGVDYTDYRRFWAALDKALASILTWCSSMVAPRKVPSDWCRRGQRPIVP
jgi:hypothetical protein